MATEADTALVPDALEPSAPRASRSYDRVVARVRQHRGLPVTVAFFTYSAVASLVFWPIGLFGSDRVTFAGDDVAEMAWLLAWPADALRHLTNPLFSSATNVPYGANVIATGGLWLLGVICAPVTYLFGPVGTYNFVSRLAFVCSALAMFYVLRKFVRRWPVALLGGLFYGFSPYMIGQGYDHPFLTFVPFPPFMFYCLYQLFGPRQWSARRIGLTFGLCAVAQFLIGAEVFADVVVLSVIGLITLALARRAQFVSDLRGALVAAGFALGTFVVLAGYPAWFAAFGPQHMAGSPQPAELAGFRADLLGPIVPSNLLVLAPHALSSIAQRFASGDWVENGSYLGLPLCLALIAVVICCWRDRLVRLLAWIGLVAFVLSLGSPLTVGTRATRVRLPFALFSRLPFLKDMAAVRYSLFVALSAALIGAIGLDRLLDASLAARRAARAGAQRTAPVRALLVTALLVVVLVPLVPRLPDPTTPTGTPVYFLNGDAKAIPNGSVVLSYPSPIWPYTQPAVWQAETNMRFKLFGGYVPAPQDYTDVGEGTPILLQPSALQEVFAAAAFNAPPTALYGAHASASLPPKNEATAQAFREFCRRYGVQTIVADPSLGAFPSLALTYLAAAFGPPSSTTGGVDVWYDVARRVATARGR